MGYFGYHYYLEQQFKSHLVPAKINAKAEAYEENSQGVDNQLRFSQMSALQHQAIEKGIQNQVSGHLRIPALKTTLPIFRGATPYTLSLGVATYFYEDAEMGKGNFVVAGHDMLLPGVLFSDLHQLTMGDALDLMDTSTIYRYRVDKRFIVPETYTLINGQPEAGSFLSLPTEGEHPKLTLFTCVYTDKGKERLVVQGHLSQQFPNGD